MDHANDIDNISKGVCSVIGTTSSTSDTPFIVAVFSSSWESTSRLIDKCYAYLREMERENQCRFVYTINNNSMELQNTANGNDIRQIRCYPPPAISNLRGFEPHMVFAERTLLDKEGFSSEIRKLKATFVRVE